MNSPWKTPSPNAMSSDAQLSPITRNYICRLLRQVDDWESARLLEFKSHLSADNGARLNDRLAEIYPDPAQLAVIILQLNNLVYFHKEICPQTSLYPEYREQLMYIKQRVFELLGFTGN